MEVITAICISLPPLFLSRKKERGIPFSHPQQDQSRDYLHVSLFDTLIRTMSSSGDRTEMFSPYTLSGEHHQYLFLRNS